MSVYLIIFCFLFICVCIEYINRTVGNKLFYFEYIILTVFICFRYGQGPDYFAYEWNYKITPVISDVLSITAFKESTAHGEIGWLILCSIFKKLNLNFEIFAFIISGLTMFFFNKFVNKWCENKTLALFISFHTVYLTYFFSAIREGFIISVFLGILLEDLIKKKRKQYIIVVLLCSLIHTVALAYIFLLIFDLLKIQRFKLTSSIRYVFLCFSIMVGLVISTGIFNKVLYKIIPQYSLYIGNTTISVAMLERIALFIFCSYIVKVYSNYSTKTEYKILVKFLNIDFTGLCLYFMLIFSPLISSRVNILFKVIEIAIISTCAAKIKTSKTMVYLAMCFIVMIFVYKNINEYIVWGDYYENINFWNYPYVTIFNKNKIFDYAKCIYHFFECK